MNSSVRSFLSRGITAGLLGLGILALGGCVYQLGSSLPRDLKTAYVPTFVNKCGEPQAETRATSAAIAEFQKDGTLRVVKSAAQADLVVDVTLIKCKLDPVSFERNDPGTTKEYRLVLGAEVVVTKTKDKQLLTKKTVEGEATFAAGSDLSTSKRSALSPAATDLAHKIIESVVEAW